MYHYTVPKAKHLRVIVDTDCKNEADDQYALTHHLMTPRFDIQAINATHFEVRNHDGTSMGQSYDEIMKILRLTGNEGKYRVLKGSQYPLWYDEAERATPEVRHAPFMPEVKWFENEASRFIVEEAKREDPRPLFVVCLGALTNVATALLMDPSIADRFTCVWIGGGKYPTGAFEFNLLQDIPAANIVFSSKLNLWQVPNTTYGMMKISLAELQTKVRPHGAIGKYLFDQLVELNDDYANSDWPAGEMWCLGDQPTVTLLMMSDMFQDYEIVTAPLFSRDMFYVQCPTNRSIRVYKSVDPRFTFEDFFAKLEINFPAEK